MTILPLSFSPLFFHSIFIFPSKNHLSLSILLPPPSLHLAPTHGHGQSLPPPPASSSLLASCSDTRAQAAAARPPTVPCRGTVSWCCSDPAVLRCGTGFRHRSAARAERSPRGGAQHASGGQRRHARWSRRRSRVELQFLALCPPSCSGHRVFRGFVAGAGAETEVSFGRASPAASRAAPAPGEALPNVCFVTGFTCEAGPETIGGLHRQGEAMKSWLHAAYTSI